TTLVSFTTVATASATGPATEAVATTCATSCTLAPDHAPKPWASSPSGPCRTGNTKIARPPKMVTNATEVANSSSSLSLTASMAAAAEAPQIEKPVATNSVVPLLVPSSLPASRVPANVVATVTTTTSRIPTSSRKIWPAASCNPSSTT